LLWVAQRLVERGADRAIGRPGQATVWRRAVVEFGKLVVWIAARIVPTNIQAAIGRDTDSAEPMVGAGTEIINSDRRAPACASVCAAREHDVTGVGTCNRRTQGIDVAPGLIGGTIHHYPGLAKQPVGINVAAAERQPSAKVHWNGQVKGRGGAGVAGVGR